MSSRSHLSRRSVVRGAGVCLSLPFLDAMMPTRAMAAQTKATKAPKRLAVFSVPFGMVQEKFHPKNTGFNYALSPTLEPLKALKEDFTVFTNLDHDVRGGHSACHTFLSGVKVTERAAYRDGNVTIDQRAAELLGHQTRFSSLNFWQEGMSFTRTGVRVPAFRKPSDAFKALFVNESADTKKSTRAALATSGSILDTVAEDAGRLKRKLSTADQNKLGEYFDSIRETEKKLEMSKSWIDKPKPKMNDSSAKKIAEGKRDDKVGGNMVEVWFDLMYLAMVTDSTRIVATAADNCNWGLDGVQDSFHTLSHHGMRKDKLDQLNIVETYLMTQYGRFVQRLKDTKEPTGGSMLESTQVFFGSGLGSGSRHSCTNLPLLLAGGGFKHGQHIDGKRKQPLGNLYLSILQQMGCEMDKFNTSQSTLTGLNA